MLKSLNEQINKADERLAEIVKDDEVVKRLTTVPGVGPVAATTYAATLDGAARFQNAKQVRSYLGLVPREHSSGEKQHRGRISKAGNSRARALLVEAAWALLRWKTPKTQALHEWATRIAARRGRAVPARSGVYSQRLLSDLAYESRAACTGSAQAALRYRIG